MQIFHKFNLKWRINKMKLYCSQAYNSRTNFSVQENENEKNFVITEQNGYSHVCDYKKKKNIIIRM